MGQLGRRRPSAALVVAIIALVVAASGSAFAAGRLVSGDHLIRKHSLSGDQLRNDTLTGQQIRLSSLGEVPSAKSAGDAGTLGGHGPGAFESASNFTRSEAFGTRMTPGTPQEISDAGPDSQFVDNSGGTLVDFVAPPQAYMGYLVDAVFMPGTSTPCAASLVLGKS